MPTISSQRKHGSKLGHRTEAEALFRAIAVAIKEDDMDTLVKLCDSLAADILDSHGYVSISFDPWQKGKMLSILVAVTIKLWRDDEEFHSLTRTYETDRIDLSDEHPSNLMLGAGVARDIAIIIPIAFHEMFKEMLLRDEGETLEDYEGHAFYALMQDV